MACGACKKSRMGTAGVKSASRARSASKPTSSRATAYAAAQKAHQQKIKGNNE